jgi:hypothetical protein
MGLCNQDEKVLVGVHVMQNAYRAARQEALTNLQNRPVPSTDLVGLIHQEMSAFDYD